MGEGEKIIIVGMILMAGSIVLGRMPHYETVLILNWTTGIVGGLMVVVGWGIILRDSR